MGIMDYTPVKYENGRIRILDQTLLPGECRFVPVYGLDEMYYAIKSLAVRGAPAIGVAAAYAVLCDAKDLVNSGMGIEYLPKRGEYLVSARPTAVNLAWAVNRMVGVYEANKEKYADEIIALLEEEAEAIRREDFDACMAMGENGLSLLEPGMGILTHCNAGALATAGYGTALAPLHLGQERGYNFKVYADETRPLLQGARLTAWELMQSGVDVTLICDNMASLVMKKGLVDAIVVGCDRMAANGDGANKIGTSGLAILAKEYGIPFYMFVPTSTIDMDTATGEDIVIEERGGREIYTMWYEEPMAPSGIKTFNPAFDVTPCEYITAVVTEKGVLRPPYSESLRKLMEEQLCTK